MGLDTLLEKIITAGLSFLLALLSTPSQQQTQEVPASITAEVISVIDGDTILVKINGQQETVRYIGIDTPEPYRDGDPACWSKEASARNKALVEGKEVTLVSDVDEKDRYDRLLRYVYVDGVFVNEVLLKEGHARTLVVQPNTRHADIFMHIQDEAQENNLGQWSAVCN
jgi:micrococcal nuclease